MSFNPADQMFPTPVPTVVPPKGSSSSSVPQPLTALATTAQPLPTTGLTLH